MALRNFKTTINMYLCNSRIVSLVSPTSFKNPEQIFVIQEGRERVDDLERPGRPSTSTDEQHVNQTIRTLLRIIQCANINMFLSFYTIIIDLDFKFPFSYFCEGKICKH